MDVDLFFFSLFIIVVCIYLKRHTYVLGALVFVGTPKIAPNPIEAMHLISHIRKFIDMPRNAYDLRYHAHVLANKLTFTEMLNVPSVHARLNYGLLQYRCALCVCKRVSLRFGFDFGLGSGFGFGCHLNLFHLFVQMWNVNIMEYSVYKYEYADERHRHDAPWQKWKFDMEKKRFRFYAKTKLNKKQTKCHDAIGPSPLFNWFVLWLFTRWLCINCQFHGSQ